MGGGVVARDIGRSEEDEIMNPSRLDAIDTRWSLIRLAHAGAMDANTTQARQALVLRYAGALRKYLGKIVANPDDADELAQDAMMRLMQGDFAGANPTRGRFRDFLKTAVRNMVRNYWTKQNRRKPADADLTQLPDDDETNDIEWQAAWQKTVLDHALAALKSSEKSGAAGAFSRILKLRADFPDATSEELAAKLSAELGTAVRPDAARQMLRRARLKFAECLIDELRRGLDDDTPARVLEELADLQLLEHVRDFLPADYAISGQLA
jgi:RNA polymerase sigma factor (sigma-70 family)